jgi:hypothetical protein
LDTAILALRIAPGCESGHADGRKKPRWRRAFFISGVGLPIAGAHPERNVRWSVFKRKPAPHLDSGVDTGSREENASKQESRASVLIQSEPKL